MASVTVTYPDCPPPGPPGSPTYTFKDCAPDDAAIRAAILATAIDGRRYVGHLPAVGTPASVTLVFAFGPIPPAPE